MSLLTKRFIDCTIPEAICKVFGHQFNRLELIIFEIKNTPANVARHGFYEITCPRCGEMFTPEPDPVVVDGSKSQGYPPPPQVPVPAGPIPPVDDD